MLRKSVSKKLSNSSNKIQTDKNVDDPDEQGSEMESDDDIYSDGDFSSFDNVPKDENVPEMTTFTIEILLTS